MNKPALEHRAAIRALPDGIARPLWSVMIPTYNCAGYLRETLASVLRQDPGPDLMQIEVVDDHSTADDPEAVVEELGRGRVGFYRQPANIGYIRNFETCLERSRGRLVHLLHGDDCVRDGFYHKLGQAFEQHPQIGAAFCRHILMDAQGHWQIISWLEQADSGILQDWLRRIVLEQRIQTPSIVVRRDVYERLGGFDRRLACAGEDWEMWIRIAAEFPFWYEVEPLALYRMRPASLSGQGRRTSQYARDLTNVLEIAGSYLPAYVPSQVAGELLAQARDGVALTAVRDAGRAIERKELAAAAAHIRAALACSRSFGVIRQILGLAWRTLALWARARVKAAYVGSVGSSGR